MSSVKEIVAAAERLPLKQLLVLQEELKRVEERVWARESRDAAAELKKQGVTDRQIDQMVTRRRREGRR